MRCVWGHTKGSAHLHHGSDVRAVPVAARREAHLKTTGNTREIEKGSETHPAGSPRRSNTFLYSSSRRLGASSVTVVSSRPGPPAPARPCTVFLTSLHSSTRTRTDSASAFSSGACTDKWMDTHRCHTQG